MFLVGLVVLSLIGALVVWLRERTPQSMEAHMKAFERELDALSPKTPIEAGPRRRRPPSPERRDRPHPRGPTAG